MMDPRSPIEQQAYVDIEIVVNEGLSQLSSGEKTVFNTKLCDHISMSVDDPLLANEGNSSSRSVKDGGKEKRKKGSISAKKPPKPPRPHPHPHPHRGFSLDEKLIKELAELAMIKRARIERMKALMQKKASKAASSSSSSNATLFAMLFTIIFFVIILFQGMSCQNSQGTSEGSPQIAQTNENNLIYVQVQGQLNPSAHSFI